LYKIVNCYEQFLDDNKNIKIVKVTSSKILEKEDRKMIKQYLETELLNQKIEIKFDDDSSIIGGILVQYDNNILDLSIAGALKKIEDVTKKALNL
jgi:F-type H+-transporting ATPase subunit delta